MQTGGAEMVREYAGSTVFLGSRVVTNRKCASRATLCGKQCGKRGKHGFPSLASRSHVGRKRAGSPSPPFRGGGFPPQATSGFWS